MASKHIRADINYAYPTAEIAVMGPQGAVKILYRKELEESSDPDKFTREKVQEFRDKFANPFIAAERGYIDEIIEPQETRPKLIRALEMTANKRDTNPPKKHGNIPL
jgi:propionyl-CoA carboxylase beta chain